MAISSQPVVLLNAGDHSPARPAGRAAWKRFLVPSFLDCFYISLVIWMFAGGPHGWLGLLIDGDTGWHIRTGEYVLQHGSVPRGDLFSFSKAGEPWFAWEWLADVILALLYGWAGLKGVVLLAGLLIPLASTIVFRRAMCGGANLFIALAIALLGVGASSVHNLARPHVFTTVLLALSLWLLDADRARPGRAIWLLVPLIAIWTNIHGGFAALIASLGIAAAGCFIEGWASAELRSQRWTAARRYTLLTGACGIATLLNPYGIQLHVHIADYLRSDWIRSAVQEFQSPSFRDESMLQFEALLIVAVMAAGSLIRRVRWTEALMIVFWAHMALGSVRHVPIFVVVATPILAAEATRWWQAAIERVPKASVWRIFESLSRDLAAGFRRSSAWTLAAIAALVILDQPLKWPHDFPAEKFPVKLVDRHGPELARSRVFTLDQWADYLIYRSWPQQKVFFDGRSDFYGKELGQQYLRLLEGRSGWEDILRRYGFRLVLIPPDGPLSSLLKRHPGWEIVEDTGQAILLRRKGLDKSGGTAAGIGTIGPGVVKKSQRCLMKMTEPAEDSKGDLQA